eukprot:GHVT01028163.1.p1 GENE.GHVT01028163.1~~GHVT01028163.1.p1  ORF type:complete len:285 (+),score=78.58 GHVT01028163.1:430-1284(+)
MGIRVVSVLWRYPLTALALVLLLSNWSVEAEVVRPVQELENSSGAPLPHEAAKTLEKVQTNAQEEQTEQHTLQAPTAAESASSQETTAQPGEANEQGATLEELLASVAAVQDTINTAGSNASVGAREVAIRMNQLEKKWAIANHKVESALPVEDDKSESVQSLESSIKEYNTTLTKYKQIEVGLRHARTAKATIALGVAGVVVYDAFTKCKETKPVKLTLALIALGLAGVDLASGIFNEQLKQKMAALEARRDAAKHFLATRKAEEEAEIQQEIIFKQFKPIRL